MVAGARSWQREGRRRYWALLLNNNDSKPNFVLSDPTDGAPTYDKLHTLPPGSKPKPPGILLLHSLFRPAPHACSSS